MSRNKVFYVLFLQRTKFSDKVYYVKVQNGGHMHVICGGGYMHVMCEGTTRRTCC